MKIEVIENNIEKCTRKFEVNDIIRIDQLGLRYIVQNDDIFCAVNFENGEIVTERKSLEVLSEFYYRQYDAEIITDKVKLVIDDRS